MSGDGNTHWCYQCLQLVQLRSHNPVCSCCSGEFVQELNEVVVDGQQDFAPFHEHDVSNNRFMDPFLNPRNSIMDAFVELMRQRNLGIRRSSLLLENGIVPWGSLMFADDEFECFFNGALVGSRPSNACNIYMGTSFQELVEQLITNDSGHGPPPATQSAIDSLPTIRITNRHINTDSNCPVC